MRVPVFFYLTTLLLFGGIGHAVPGATKRATGPFLTQVGNFSWIIGNEVWNMTQGQIYGVSLNYKNRDCVGKAVGHYVSYSRSQLLIFQKPPITDENTMVSIDGAASNLNWTAATISKSGTYNGKTFIDVLFSAAEGDMHWVIFSGQHGAYQYFVNHALPTLGEFRTLWRLDNETFTWGKTATREAELPPLDWYLAQNKVQDETWLMPNGTGYITKYDFTSWIRTQKYYGVYGPDTGFGSWYINPGKDYYNGDHTKQELMVREDMMGGKAEVLGG
jgi:rhamnogalacturonan endolyase